jgi:hypothetical protein
MQTAAGRENGRDGEERVAASHARSGGLGHGGRGDREDLAAGGTPRLCSAGPIAGTTTVPTSVLRRVRSSASSRSWRRRSGAVGRLLGQSGRDRRAGQVRCQLHLGMKTIMKTQKTIQTMSMRGWNVGGPLPFGVAGLSCVRIIERWHARSAASGHAEAPGKTLRLLLGERAQAQSREQTGEGVRVPITA